MRVRTKRISFFVDRSYSLKFIAFNLQNPRNPRQRSSDGCRQTKDTKNYLCSISAARKLRSSLTGAQAPSPAIAPKERDFESSPLTRLIGKGSGRYPALRSPLARLNGATILLALRALLNKEFEHRIRLQKAG